MGAVVTGIEVVQRRLVCLYVQRFKRWLSRPSTARGSSTRLVPVGPNKVKAPKSYSL